MSSATERAARQVLLIAVILVGIGVVMIYSSSSALAGTRFEDSGFFLHGCGGDRDTGKRPMMGRVAEALADCIYLTSDNPRSESPRQIIDQIAAGMQSADRVVVEPDRRQAIHAALVQPEPFRVRPCFFHPRDAEAGNGYEQREN